jgi:Flp pilus assembly pilin Flp
MHLAVPISRGVRASNPLATCNWLKHLSWLILSRYTAWVPIERMKYNKQRAASLVEYALLILSIALVAIVALQSFGFSLSARYSSVASALRE